MQPVPSSVDLRAEHAQALCLASLSPVQVACIAAGSSVASVMLSIPFEVAAHAYGQGHILLSFGIIKEPFRGLFDALKHMLKASGGLRKLVSTARSLKFARAAFSPTQPVIFTFKDMYQRMWTPPLNPLYVPPASNDVWIQWMAPHFAAGGLAGFTYAVMLQFAARFNPATLKDRAFLGARLPVAVATGRPLPNPGMPLPNQAWVTVVPFTLHRLVYHGYDAYRPPHVHSRRAYDSLAPRNPIAAVALGLAVSTVASAVADGVHHVMRVSAGLPTLDRTGFAATAKGRLVRSIPGGLALALFDQSRRIYCIGKTTLTE